MYEKVHELVWIKLKESKKFTQKLVAKRFGKWPQKRPRGWENEVIMMKLSLRAS